MKIQKKKKKFFFWGGGGGGVGLGGVRVDVNEELKFLGKLKKKKWGGGPGAGGGDPGQGGGESVWVGWGGGSGWM